jgi:TRAP-type C4-dicarboxylate transport system permease small subunit
VLTRAGPIVPMLRIFDRALLLVTSVAVAGLTALMAVVVLIGVFARYVLNDALPWPEELARYTMIWLSWLGGGLALRRGAHIAVEFVIDAMPQRLRAATVFAGRIGILLFLGICLVYGLQHVGRVSMQTTVALGVSMQIPYLAAPIGSALMVYHLLILMFVPSLDEARKTELQV